MVVVRYSVRRQSMENYFCCQMATKRYLTKVGLDALKLIMEATSQSVQDGANRLA